MTSTTEKENKINLQNSQGRILQFCQKYALKLEFVFWEQTGERSSLSDEFIEIHSRCNLIRESFG